jgi:hypothetical protein
MRCQAFFLLSGDIISHGYRSIFARSYKLLQKVLRVSNFAGIISIVREKHDLHASWFCAVQQCVVLEQRGFCMGTNNDFSRSSFLMEQYQREMAVITAALVEESQDEREERMSLVKCSWSLSCACFQGQLEVAEVPAFAAVEYARP